MKVFLANYANRARFRRPGSSLLRFPLFVEFRINFFFAFQKWKQQKAYDREPTVSKAHRHDFANF